MRRSEEAKRWLEQAEHDLKVARTVFEARIFSYTCFLAEQSAQKSLKAFLYFKGERHIWEHSVQKLAEKCASYDKEFEKFIEPGGVLDRFYLATRYPDAVAPPAVPYKLFNQEDAQKALEVAGGIFSLVKAIIEGG